MDKINSEIDIIASNVAVNNKIIVDVGCGIGKLTRVLTGMGAFVTGIDIPELIEKAVAEEKAGDEKYLTGTGQKMPIANDFADLVIFFASYHHVPQKEMDNALNEACRVAKKGGMVIFVEPVAVSGSYTELTKLADDESEIQKIAYEHIIEAEKKFPLYNELERFYYLERTFEDYKKLISIYVADDEKRENVLTKAIEKIVELGQIPEKTVFQAVVRFNLFSKK